MSLKNRNKRIRIHKEGYIILTVVFSLLVLLNLAYFFLSLERSYFTINIILSIAAFAFFLYFFRNPSRSIQSSDNNLIIAPADGRIVVIEPTEEHEYFGGERKLQISIFMSVFSVHANWYPINGLVKYVRHYNGRHMAAYLPKSSHENERSTVVIESKTGHQILLRQIAGALARRIVTYAAPNHECHLNEHLGFIKFGSRVDIFLPLNSEVYVTMNESTKGNETIIARLPD